MTTDPDSPCVLARLQTEIDAQLLINHLEAAGIRAALGGAGTSTGWPEAPGDVQVMVRQSDLGRARAERAELARSIPRVR